MQASKIASIVSNPVKSTVYREALEKEGVNVDRLNNDIAIGRHHPETSEFAAQSGVSPRQR